MIQQGADDLPKPNRVASLLKRYLVVSFVSMVGVTTVITFLLLYLHHFWLVSFALGFIWALCIQPLGWGLAHLLLPHRAIQFREALRDSYGTAFAQPGRAIDRRLGLAVDPANPSNGQARLIGVALMAFGLAVGLSSSWILLLTVDH